MPTVGAADNEAIPKKKASLLQIVCVVVAMDWQVHALILNKMPGV